MGEKLTHLDEQGNTWMVNVGGKQEADGIAMAHGFTAISPEVYQTTVNSTAKKGDVLGVAWVAGIMDVKKTSELMPLCHVLVLTKCTVEPVLHEERCTMEAVCMVKTHGKTGVEIETLTGVQIALLMIYDIYKAIDKGIVISDACLLREHGGKSGLYERKASRPGTGEKE